MEKSRNSGCVWGRDLTWIRHKDVGTVLYLRVGAGYIGAYARACVRVRALRSTVSVRYVIQFIRALKKG